MITPHSRKRSVHPHAFLDHPENHTLVLYVLLLSMSLMLLTACIYIYHLRTAMTRMTSPAPWTSVQEEMGDQIPSTYRY